MLRPNHWAINSPMEPFKLTLWLWMGARFEQTEMLNLSRAECFELRQQIYGDRRLARAECTAPGYERPTIRTFQPCAHLDCGGPLPGRRRV